MRKKEYTSPRLTVVEVETECMMAASLESVPVNQENTYDGVFNSKGHTFSIWGEDEEEF